MIERRSQLDKIIITAMDRFVWFVLLVVMSHLVTEFTRVNGYARGQRNEIVLVNDTLLQPMPVQNMLLYPAQDYGHYERPSTNMASNTLQQNAAMILSSLGAAGGINTNTNNNNHNAVSSNNNAEPSYPLFSLRPLIDSIFEIPISTLRAVNNLVGRLTGSYRQASPSMPDMAAAPEIAQKSATIRNTQLRLPAGVTHNGGDFRLKLREAPPQREKRQQAKAMVMVTSTMLPQMREELA